MKKRILLKAHISAYTRKDGTVVNAHDDKRMKMPVEHAGAYFPNHKHEIAALKDGESLNVKVGKDTHTLTRRGAEIHGVVDSAPSEPSAFSWDSLAGYGGGDSSGDSLAGYGTYRNPPA